MEAKVLVEVTTLKNALALLETREWPVKYMSTLGKVAQEIELAVSEVPTNEDKSPDTPKP